MSSQNASRYDLLAKSFVLRSECPARFQAFIDSFYAEFNPSTSTEAKLVDTMATARWRMIRMSNLEAAIIDHEYGVEPDSALTTPARATDSGRSIELMNRAESRLQQQFNSAYDRLLRIQLSQKRKGRRPSPPINGGNCDKGSADAARFARVPEKEEGAK